LHPHHLPSGAMQPCVPHKPQSWDFIKWINKKLFLVYFTYSCHLIRKFGINCFLIKNLCSLEGAAFRRCWDMHAHDSIRSRKIGIWSDLKWSEEALEAKQKAGSGKQNGTKSLGPNVINQFWKIFKNFFLICDLS
jgi:hypothetical protein